MISKPKFKSQIHPDHLLPRYYRKNKLYTSRVQLGCMLNNTSVIVFHARLIPRFKFEYVSENVEIFSGIRQKIFILIRFLPYADYILKIAAFSYNSWQAQKYGTKI